MCVGKTEIWIRKTNILDFDLKKRRIIKRGGGEGETPTRNNCNQQYSGCFPGT